MIFLPCIIIVLVLNIIIIINIIELLLLDRRIVMSTFLFCCKVSFLLLIFVPIYLLYRYLLMNIFLIEYIQIIMIFHVYRYYTDLCQKVIFLILAKVLKNIVLESFFGISKVSILFVQFSFSI